LGLMGGGLVAMRVTIKNYKSIREASIDLRPGLNILVGPNGSGKTCLLSALQFLRDVFRVGAAQALALQGGARRAYHHGQSQMSFSLTQDYGHRTYRRRKGPCQLHWQVSIAQAGPEKLATVTEERLEVISGGTRLFAVRVGRAAGAKARIGTRLARPEHFGRDLFSVWQASRKGKAELGVDLKRMISSRLSRVKDEPDRSCVPMLGGLDDALDEVITSFRFLSEYNILPDIARASTEKLPFAQMAPNGQAVSEVIDALEHQRFDKLEQLALVEAGELYGLWDAYPPLYRYWGYHQHLVGPYRKRSRMTYHTALESINQELAAAVRPITHVSVEIDPSNGKRFVVFKAERDTFYPQEVSDGTVKWLCILVSLFVPFSKVYLLEEPENFLHPWMQQRLISIMREQARQNKTIFLLASHSATVLNAALPEEILIVRQGSQGTEVSTVGDADSIRQVLAASQFHLGDLWVSGAIGGVPTHE